VIHAHRHDEWSLLDGCGSAMLHAETAANLGMPALGQTNHGTLAGSLHHIRACHKHKIMPICGIEAYYRPNRTDEIANPNHICLYAKNLKGWHSLLRLSTESHETGWYGGKAAVDLELMKKHREGVVCSTACLKSPLAQLVMSGDVRGAEKLLEQLLTIYRDDLFIELMPHDFPEQRTLNIAMYNMAVNYGVPTLATNDVHYPTPDWFKAYQVSGYMATKNSFKSIEKKKAEGKRVLEFDLPNLYLATRKEMEGSFRKAHPDLPKDAIKEALDNTMEFAQRFTPFFIDQTPKLPNVKEQVPDPRAKVLEWVQEGLDRIEKTEDQVYLDRLEFEINELDTREDVYDYFYIVGEAVRWAKEQKIRVGLGRGSAAGCLVSYLVGITNIDPIAYGLLFERFLNPNRKGMPDIDIDFSSAGRQKVKNHLADIWGHDHVADIIAHQTFKPKAVLKAVARVFDIPITEISAVTETIQIHPTDEETTLEAIKPINPILSEFAKKYPEIWEIATKLEGQPQNASKHAAGMIITAKAAKEFVPLEHAKDGGMVTAWNDSAEFAQITEYLNVMKLDFLGVSGLDRQEYAVKLIEEQTGKYFDLDNRPILRDPNATDPEVMKLFHEGKTLGIFQFSSAGMTNLLRHIKPDNVLDLVAANALYRPGPMDKAFEYGDKKKLPAEEIDYWHPAVKPFLEETRGIVAYQEQVMQVVQAIGGFTPGDADDVRKIMSKLYRLPGNEAQKVMSKYKDQWDRGCKENGIDPITRDEIWTGFLRFGNYAFNKSHSASYGVQGEIDAEIKTYYPWASYAALLTEKKDDKEIRPAIVREARTFDVSILPPDINDSELGFTLRGNDILYGLLSVTGVGDVVANHIVENRPFLSIRDFEERMREFRNTKVNKDVYENLKKCGAFDRFGVRDEFTDREKARLEKEILGISISGSGFMSKYEDLISEYSMRRDHFDALEDRGDVQIAGEIVDVKHTSTKKDNRSMAILTLVDGASEYRCTLFPGTYSKYKDTLSATAVIVRGEKNNWKGSPGVIANHMMDLEEFIEDLK
jgi:DNA polymerase-3 subunit alpha